MPPTPEIRFDEFDTKTTNLPSALIAAPELFPFPGVPSVAISSRSVVPDDRSRT